MKTPATISTLDAGETSLPRLINEENGPVPTPITFPARPIQGGKLDKAPRKTGLWFAEPKFNGWRALVHCPSGTMWNRHGGLLSIAGEFVGPMRESRAFAEAGLVWADCEAMGRRHKVGCGTLIVLDLITEDGSPVYEERRAFLESLVPLGRMSLGVEPTIPANSLLLTPSIADNDGAALRLYESLRSINRAARADVFEGVVMKRGGSLYPVQLRSAVGKMQVVAKASVVLKLVRASSPNKSRAIRALRWNGVFALGGRSCQSSALANPERIAASQTSAAATHATAA